MNDAPQPLENTEQMKVALLESLKSTGIHSPETQVLLNQWLDRRENEVQATSAPDARAVFDLERVDLFLAAGDMEFAKDALVDAYLVIVGEGLDDMMQQAWDRAESLGIDDLNTEANDKIEGAR
ncbi:MAG TPA: hypothetical protein VJH67_01005 [Candidatus Paceibacterota bacterium]